MLIPSAALLFSCVSSSRIILLSHRFWRLIPVRTPRELPGLKGPLQPQLGAPSMPYPWALKTQFSSPWDLQSLSELFCRSAGLQLSHSCPPCLTTGPLIQTSAHRLTSRARSCPVTAVLLRYLSLGCLSPRYPHQAWPSVWSVDWCPSLSSDLSHHHKLPWWSRLLVEPCYHHLAHPAHLDGGQWDRALASEGPASEISQPSQHPHNAYF